MYDQELEIKIEMMMHDGWSQIFHQDVVFPLNRANVIPFRNKLKQCLEDILNNTKGQMPYRYTSMNRLQDQGTVLKFTYYHRSHANGYRDSFTQHIVMSEEGWRSGIVMFAERIWRN